MAVHGVSRSTRDLDLLTLAGEGLGDAVWEPLRQQGIGVHIRRGDATDPLAGVVRFTSGHDALDVIVGKSPWQTEIIARATDAVIEGEHVPVARPAGLIMLKLYAGGPQDAWDITQLLEGPAGAVIAAEVDASLDKLPPDCRGLWQRIRST